LFINDYASYQAISRRILDQAAQETVEESKSRSVLSEYLATRPI
jgi:hypothetical protein